MSRSKTRILVNSRMRSGIAPDSVIAVFKSAARSPGAVMERDLMGTTPALPRSLASTRMTSAFKLLFFLYARVLCPSCGM